MERDRVMVVDDDPDFRELMTICLGDLGLVCVPAASYDEALPLLARDRGRLRMVLLDYFMPGPPPAQCARGVRERVDEGVPVVLVSAAVDIAARAREVGLENFLSKPFELDALREVVGARAAF